MSNQENTIVEGLWNEGVTPANYGKEEQYFDHIFEQYKLFVEMADRVSGRRNLANTFFLTLHTLFISAIAFVYEKGPQITNQWLNLFPLLALLALTYVWWRSIISYRQLNSVKYRVIGEYEKRLPSSPYWGAEWNALGKGKNTRKYHPLTDIEKYVPAFFALIYIMGFIAITFL